MVPRGWCGIPKGRIPCIPRHTLRVQTHSMPSSQPQPKRILLHDARQPMSVPNNISDQPPHESSKPLPCAISVRRSMQVHDSRDDAREGKLSGSASDAGKHIAVRNIGRTTSLAVYPGEVDATSLERGVARQSPDDGRHAAVTRHEMVTAVQGHGCPQQSGQAALQRHEGTVPVVRRVVRFHQ